MPTSIISSRPVLEKPGPDWTKVVISHGRGCSGRTPLDSSLLVFLGIFVAFSFKQLLGFLSRSRRKMPRKEGGESPTLIKLSGDRIKINLHLNM